MDSLESEVERRIRKRLQPQFELLDLSPLVSPRQIKMRFRELAKQYHPDRHMREGALAAEAAKRRFVEVREAYQLLMTELDR